MKKFFTFIIKQSVAIVLIVVFVLGFGVFATTQMSVNLLPDINVPMVCVQVIYAGANAQSVEKDVTVKLEDGLSAVGYTSVDSYSYDNLSAVVLSFDYGTDTTDKKSEIQSKLNSIDLPDGVVTSVYDIDLNAEALAVLSVTSDKGADDNEKLENAYKSAKEIADGISALDGVESVEIKGGAETSFIVQPFGGLELLSPLLVEAFSYGELDLPLGNITVNGANVQIRNNSDVAAREDIDNMPVSLPPSVVTLLASIKQLTSLYQNSDEEELRKLQEDLESTDETGYGVLQVLKDIDTTSADELDEIAELSLYMNLVDTCTQAQLNGIHTALYKRVENKDEKQLEALADELNASGVLPVTVTADMLKAVQDGKVKDLADFRGKYPDSHEFTDAEYVLLAKETGVFSGLTDAEIQQKVTFAKKTSATGLSAIADKKREAEAAGETYAPTDAECAALFAATELSAEHPVIMSPTFIAFVRSDGYGENMQILIDRRANLPDEITAEQFYGLYQDLSADGKLDGVFDFKVSRELLGFILDTDLSETNAGGGLTVRVNEIATVKLEDGFSSYVYYGSGGAKIIKGAVIEVYKSNGANSSAVVAAVKDVYAKFLKSDGQGVSVKLLDDQSEFITDSISNVLISMLIGGVLAVLVIFLFLKKVRTSLIIAVTMPLSVLATLICLFLMGITLNMVSLGGLAVGIGMLVDNSIVVIESISKHRDMDKSAFEAAVDGTTEVGGALFGSTLTTVCVFIPIIFSGGLTAEIFTDLSWAVIFSLAFSLIVSVSVIPALYALFAGKKRMLKGGRLKRKEPDKTEKAAECVAGAGEAVAGETVTGATETRAAAESETVTGEAGAGEAAQKAARKKRLKLPELKVMEKVTAFYDKALAAVLGKKLVTILTAVAVFGASIGLLFLTGTEFLPSIDKGQIEVNMSYGATARLEDIQRDVLEFSEEINEKIDNVEYVSASVGKNGLLALTDTGIIKIQLTTNRGTDGVVNKIRGLAEKFEGTQGGALERTVTVKQIDGVVASLMSGTDDLSVTVVGDDGETLKEIAAKIGEKLEEKNFKDVKNSATEKSTQYTLRFDRYETARLGLDYKTVVLTMRIGIASYTACTVTIDDTVYNLNVRFADGAITSKEDLENFVLGYDAATGNAIKVKDVLADGGIIKEEAEACIRRSNGKQMISISATLPGTDTGTAGKLMQSVAGEVLNGYDGYSFESSGISSYLTDAFQGLAVALVISFFLLFAVMAVQFGSALKPLIIMASIPFSFTGGFIALVITGTSLNVVSFIGLIMLMGVVVNNAIVMLEKISQLHAEGMAHYEAVKEACKTRLRPILMTTLTTILALIPMAIGVGQGSELMQPLGIVVIGGLLIGTLVTLVLVPCVYCAVHRIIKP